MWSLPVVLVALAAYSKYMAPERRKLNYEEGTCDGYIYTEYFWLMIGLQCWAIYYVSTSSSPGRLFSRRRPAIPSLLLTRSLPAVACSVSR